MALTYTMDSPKTGPMRAGNGRKRWIGTITLDAAYPAGGWAISPASVGMYFVIESLLNQSFHKSYHFHFDQVNQKLQAFQKGLLTGATAAAAAEVGAVAVNQGGVEQNVRLPKSAVSTFYDVVKHQEAAASDANLNGIVLRVEAVGY